MAKVARPYEEGLHERLRDISHAVSYIKAAAEDSIDGFLLALRDVAEATKGMSGVANAADKNRENLYRMLSKDGNPRLDSLWAVLHAMGLRIAVVPVDEDRTPGDTTPNDSEVVRRSHGAASEGNSLSGGYDRAESCLDFGMITLSAQARKGPRRALENFATVGRSVIAEQTGGLVGRQ
jgi:probable addiction module antidote protein